MPPVDTASMLSRVYLYSSFTLGGQDSTGKRKPSAVHAKCMQFRPSAQAISREYFRRTIHAQTTTLILASANRKIIQTVLFLTHLPDCLLQALIDLMTS